jgi:hypothetical protein
VHVNAAEPSHGEPPTGRGVPRAALLVAVGLVALLIVGVVVGRFVAGAHAGSSANTPLALARVPAPGASSPACASLVDALPAALPSHDSQLPRRKLAQPAPPATAAWAYDHSPIVLRCGVAEPGELTPTSHLLSVSGVGWLRVRGNGGASTWYAVDRKVYVALTVPAGAGTGPIQQVSASISGTLPAQPVRP